MADLPDDDGDARSIALGAGREFDLIRDLVAGWGPLARGIGDDAALLDVPPGERLVVSTDTSVEGVHFRADWLTPREIGWRATAAALSDLAAMASVPLGILVALSAPRRWLAELRALAAGIGEAVTEAGTVIVGGDVTRAEQLTLGITVLGRTRHPLSRAGAHIGDAIYVTGSLGGPQAAIQALMAGRALAPAHRARFARPVPRLREGAWLASHGAHAGIDISDGLLADLDHVAHASGVRLVVELERVPAMDGVSADDALRSGEEYELAVAAPSSLDVAEFSRTFALPLTRVGRAERGEPGVTLTEHGTPLSDERVASLRGWDHLSS